MSDDREQKPIQERKVLTAESNSSSSSSSYQTHAAGSFSNSSVATSRTSSTVNSLNSNVNNIYSNQKAGPPYSVVNIDSTLPSSQTPKKVFEAYDDRKNVSYDHDENKYQRKSAIEWFLRWWKSITGPTSSRRRFIAGTVYRRNVIIIIVIIVLFILLMTIMSWLGKMATDGDPSYNLFNNPMINVQQENEPSN